jgi:crotonobetainyl-CoA:carnitine CoA-transferase CaiB-like acyl-CoA transferase
VILDAAFAERTSADWLAVLAEAGVPSAPVNDVASALEDRQAAARGSIVELEHPALGTVRQVASPLRLGDEQPLARAPFRGEHTESVLTDVCGYSGERIRELAAAGVFGDQKEAT